MIYLIDKKLCVKLGVYRFIRCYVDKDYLLHNNWSREGSWWGVYRYRVLKDSSLI